jgi:hypothetical protein
MVTKIDNSAYAMILSYINPATTSYFIDVLSTKLLNDTEAWSWGVFTMGMANLDGMLRAASEKKTNIGTKIAEVIIKNTKDRKIRNLVVAMSALHPPLHMNVVCLDHRRMLEATDVNSWAKHYPFHLSRLTSANKHFHTRVSNKLTKFIDKPCLWDLYITCELYVDKIYFQNGVDIVARRYNGKNIVHLREISPDMFDGVEGHDDIIISPYDCVLTITDNGDDIDVVRESAFNVHDLGNYAQHKLLIYAICYQAMTVDIRDVILEWFCAINRFDWGDHSVYEHLIWYMSQCQRTFLRDVRYDAEDRIVFIPDNGQYAFKFVDNFIANCKNTDYISIESSLGVNRRRECKKRRRMSRKK